ncbi:hypothetical protein FD755_019220, partial [Muntiacus reevesi]
PSLQFGPLFCLEPDRRVGRKRLTSNCLWCANTLKKYMVYIHRGKFSSVQSLSRPTPVFLPGESHGQRSLVGYSPQGHKESDTTERLHFHI